MLKASDIGRRAEPKREAAGFYANPLLQQE